LDYTYDPGGGAVGLLSLIVPDDSLLPPSINGWAGLAQPEEIRCRKITGAAAPLPPDFECRFSHPHRRWASVNQSGEFQGMAIGKHDHVFRMDEWVLADVEIAPGLLESHWFGSHRH
jgi:hypothetical protein